MLFTNCSIQFTAMEQEENGKILFSVLDVAQKLNSKKSVYHHSWANYLSQENESSEDLRSVFKQLQVKLFDKLL